MLKYSAGLAVSKYPRTPKTFDCIESGNKRVRFGESSPNRVLFLHFPVWCAYCKLVITRAPGLIGSASTCSRSQFECIHQNTYNAMVSILSLFYVSEKLSRQKSKTLRYKHCSSHIDVSRRVQAVEKEECRVIYSILR